MVFEVPSNPSHSIILSHSLFDFSLVLLDLGQNPSQTPLGIIFMWTVYIPVCILSAVVKRDMLVRSTVDYPILPYPKICNVEFLSPNGRATVGMLTKWFWSYVLISVNWKSRIPHPFSYFYRLFHQTFNGYLFSPHSTQQTYKYERIILKTSLKVRNMNCPVRCFHALNLNRGSSSFIGGSQ